MHHTSLTPFGRQPVTAALLATRQQGADSPALPAIDKWTLFNELRIARRSFGLSDRDLAVLYALLSFLPGRELRSDMSLVVFPSNATLSDRAHGMAESTLRRHLAALIAAGVIWRQDSPNGKRYARRDASGILSQAYGFDLRPLLRRAAEILQTASAATAESSARTAARDAVVVQLRDATKLLAYAEANDLPGNWPMLASRLGDLRRQLRRTNPLAVLTAMNHQARDILVEISRNLALTTSETSGAAARNDCHHTSSKQDSPESELRDDVAAPAVTAGHTTPTAPNLPVQLVVKACPELRLYARNNLESWRDIVTTAETLRPMIGVSTETWREAQRVLGPECAAVTLAAILQRFGQINSPGAYLRSLCKKALTGGFSTTRMIMALLNAPVSG